MKISVLTLHRVFNYGSVLQTYATQKILSDLGHDVEVIDYIPKDWQNKSLFWNITQSRGIIKDSIYRILRAFSVILKKNTFWRFLRNNVDLTKKYYSYSDLKKDIPVSDVYCTGSDQVWNSTYCHMDKVFYLDFLPQKAKRISYAASFGNTVLGEKEEREVSKYLLKYSALSVREDSAVNILKKMNLNSICVIDPTLQLPKEHWISLASKRLVKDKYLVLMLLYNEDNGATDIARKIADEKNLKLVKISWELIKPPKADILMTHRTPNDFISLFYYADFVVTNSFHGMAFAINLNKQFVAIKRDEFNSRLENLLKLTKLENRMIDSYNQLDVINSDVDYEPVNKILTNERNKAEQFLKEHLVND